MDKNADHAPPDAARLKGERIVARVNAEQKRLFQRAAALQGRSLSDFLVASAQDAAQRAIRDEEVMVLGARDSAAFVAGLLNPPPVNDRLRETIRRYRDLTPPAGG
jgi:uncharacterized protein (DUF1778 family)